MSAPATIQPTARGPRLVSLVKRGLLAHEPIPGGQRFHFKDVPNIENAVRALVEIERLADESLSSSLYPSGWRVVLELCGSSESQATIAGMFKPEWQPPA